MILDNLKKSQSNIITHPKVFNLDIIIPFQNVLHSSHVGPASSLVFSTLGESYALFSVYQSLALKHFSEIDT